MLLTALGGAALASGEQERAKRLLVVCLEACRDLRVPESAHRDLVPPCKCVQIEAWRTRLGFAPLWHWLSADLALPLFLFRSAAVRLWGRRLRVAASPEHVGIDDIVELHRVDLLWLGR